MQAHFILIDFENVQPAAIEALDRPGIRVMLFAGATQTRVPYELAAALQRIGERAQYVKISGDGKNALDFHIAFYIGQLAALHPQARFHIVSKDAGFDPLIQHLQARKIAVTRAAGLPRVPTKGMEPALPAERIATVTAHLQRLNSTRPRTLKTLSNAIAAMFQKQLTAKEIDAVVDALKENGTIVVKDNKIQYALA